PVAGWCLLPRPAASKVCYSSSGATRVTLQTRQAPPSRAHRAVQRSPQQTGSLLVALLPPPIAARPRGGPRLASVCSRLLFLLALLDAFPVAQRLALGAFDRSLCDRGMEGRAWQVPRAAERLARGSAVDRRLGRRSCSARLRRGARRRHRPRCRGEGDADEQVWAS